jgi:hypothetical protein
MISDLDQFYENKEEPNKSCFLALRSIFLNFDDNISESWKYKLPFFLYRGKMFCYLWKDKTTNHPYIGVVKGSEVTHFKLEKGNRKKMKIFSINPNEDIPMKELLEVLNKAKSLY